MKAVRLYYAFQAFFTLLLWLPVFYEYQLRMGLSDPEIFGIQSVYYLLFIFFEVPTGFASDRWGHRRCLTFGAGILAVANALPVFWTDYWGFFAHFLLIALGRSLVSGAASAYIYEHLKESGEGDAYRQVEGRARAISLIARVAGWAAAGHLMAWNAGAPYWLSAVASVFAVLFALRLPPLSGDVSDDAIQGRRGAGPSRITGTRALREAGAAMLRSPTLILLMLLGAGIFVLARVVQVNLFQPVLAAKGFGLESYGWIMAGMAVFEALGAAHPNWIRRFGVSDLGAVTFLTVAIAGTLFLLAGGGQTAVIAAFAIFAFCSGVAFPIQKQLLNDAVSASESTRRLRATLLSVESIVDRAACAPVVALMGPWIAQGRLPELLQVVATGVLMLVLGVALILFRVVGKARVRQSANHWTY